MTATLATGATQKADILTGVTKVATVTVMVVLKLEFVLTSHDDFRSSWRDTRARVRARHGVR